MFLNESFKYILKNFGLSLYIIYMLLYPLNSSYSISINDSVYTGKAIRTDSSLIGGWMHYAYKCNFGYNFNISDKVAKLSWYDYKSFINGWNQWNGKEPYCLNSKKKQIENWRKKYLSSLENYLLENNFLPENDKQETKNIVVIDEDSKDKINQANKIAENAKKEAELLKQKLAQLQSQQQKKQQQISQDNQIPLINAMTYNDTDTNAIIQGIITDNVEVAEVTVDNQLVPLNKDGSFQTNLYIPRNGKTIEIVAFDLKGNRAVKIIQLNRNEIEEASGPQFASLNPSGKRAKPNPNALALIIGVADYKETPAKAMYARSSANSLA